VELGLSKERNYTEATEKNKIPLYTAKFYNINYLFPIFFVLYSNTIKGKKFIVEMKVTQRVTANIYIYIYIYIYFHIRTLD
jgi:hypothetical protein